MTLAGGEFCFEGDVTIALTGSDFGAGLPLWTPIEIRSGQTVRCGVSKSGARAYLAVRGGLGVRRVMGSASVHVMTGVGGRPLRKGDVLTIGNEYVRRPRSPARTPPCYQSKLSLRVTAGPQATWFGQELYCSAYTVAEECNRMGIRLKGAPLANTGGHMITEGVPLGAIQAPPDGQPIILFVEHQTTGGYPKPANVISADFWRLGQLRPRDEVRFERVTMEGAVELLRDQEAWLYSL
jgi:antagonist of KipI